MRRRRDRRGNKQMQKAGSKKELSVFEGQMERQDGWNVKSEGASCTRWDEGRRWASFVPQVLSRKDPSLVRLHICRAQPIACCRCPIYVNRFVKIKKESPWLKSDSLTWYLFGYVSWLAGWSFHFVCLFIQHLLYCYTKLGLSNTKQKRWYGPVISSLVSNLVSWDIGQVMQPLWASVIHG